MSTGKIFFIVTLCLCAFVPRVFSEEKKQEGIILNADSVEYETDSKFVKASGNVEIFYKGSKLTCRDLRMNTQTKEGTASGGVRLDDQQGTIEGELMIYNFETKKGVMLDADFRANPYFGRAEKVEKVSDNEFIAKYGYATTCSYDNPHYRIASKKITMIPGDKVQTRDDIVYLGIVPLACLPVYNKSLKDPMMHVQIMPGKRKDWGYYFLSAWRYNLTDYVTGRIYADYRDKLGMAEGFGANYTTQGFGKGDFKYYYTQQRQKGLEEGTPAEFERYLIRWRHQWAIDENTDFTAQFVRIYDAKRAVLGDQYNILKDFFYREYEKDELPLTYLTMHHNFSYSTLDLLVQKRVNDWYSQAQMLPEIKFTLPSLQMGSSPFYFEDISTYVNSSSKVPTASTSSTPDPYNQFNTLNKISLPMKVAFISFTPFFSVDETYTMPGNYGATLKSVLTPGVNMSTKFYRLFKVDGNLLGLDLHGLRHIITPTVGYSFISTTDSPVSKLRVGSGYTTSTSPIIMQLENKLQTKRENQSVDLAYLKINTTYDLKPASEFKRRGSFSDVLFDFELKPYSWLRVVADATYTHSGDPSAQNYNKFSLYDYDANFEFGPERSFGIGQRYARKGSSELTFSLIYRFTPKWKLALYQRRNFHKTSSIGQGLIEQQYVLTRDFHCWEVDCTYDVKRGYGESIYFTFRLKAFPEMEFEFNQSYHEPKPGSQSNP